MTRHRLRSVFSVLAAFVLVLPRDLPAADFLRGDVDGSGRVAVSDAIRILLHLFQGDASAVPCADAADADDSGAIDLADAIRLLSGLFQGGSAPAAPFPGCGADPTDDALGCEEACPPLSVYFEKEFREDGLFFVIDRSGTMQDNGELGRAKQETERLIEALPTGVEFGIIFSDANRIRFPFNGQPAESTEEMKASAVAFIQGTPGGSGSCDLPSLLTALDFARASRALSSAVFYVTDGGGTCSGAEESAYLERLRDTVTAQNAGLARIHTFQVSPGRQLQDSHLEDLALRNGGTYTPLPPP
jgi:hypothetical protein